MVLCIRLFLYNLIKTSVILSFLCLTPSVSAFDSRSKLLYHAHIAAAVARGIFVASSVQNHVRGKSAIKIDIARDVARVLCAVIDLMKNDLDYDPTRNPAEGSYYSAAWLVYDVMLLGKNIMKYATGLSAVNCSISKKKFANDKLENVVRFYKELVHPMLEGGAAFCVASNVGPLKITTRRHVRSIGSLTRLLDEILLADIKPSDKKLLITGIGAHIILCIYEYSKDIKF